MAKQAEKTAKKDDKPTRFLAAIRAGLPVKVACIRAEWTRAFALKLYAADEKFAAAWEEAKLDGAESLEAEAVRRAVSGIDEPLFYHGKPAMKERWDPDAKRMVPTGEQWTVRKYSDDLLKFLLAGAMPEKYRQRHEIGGLKDAPAIPIAIESLTDVQLDKLIARIEVAIRARKAAA